MTVSDEMLMAFADGELDSAARAEVEAELAASPELAARLAEHRALRERLRAAYQGVLDEPVPGRLVTAARAAPDNVVPLHDRARTLRVSRLPQWAAMAASLLVGVMIARVLPQPDEGGPLVTRAGRLVASGALAQALSKQLASEPGDAAIRIGLSFRQQDGGYCRSFRMQRSAASGLACRDAGEWQVVALAASENTAAPEDAARQAAGDMPAAVIDAIEERISGEPLDASGEASARTNGWQR